MTDIKGGRLGISTGACAAGAAKAAVLLLTTGERPRMVSVTLPSGEELSLDVIVSPDGRCGVIKDAGSDIDVTGGLAVMAKVALGKVAGGIVFLAGEGVGTVTLPGLKVPPGEPAINPVPRMMIESSVREVAGSRSIRVEISIPGGEEVSPRTFNRRLGIVGGLSILGTSGRVRPMDEQSILESLSLELNTHAARGRNIVALTFAGVGERATRAAWNLPEGVVVQAANEMGYALDECVSLGIVSVIVAGHPGKMLKISSGGFKTHNRVSDGRMEALCTHIAMITDSPGLVRSVYEAATTEAAIDMLDDRLSADDLKRLWNSLAERASRRCVERSFGALDAGAAFIRNDGRILGASGNIGRLVERIRNIGE
ncbi:MAG: cobalt-precorrin-5B (C(1))-methyltransferase CbiD [Synergistaceae bacterium]|jgi:cobalt-precorrin-5B (C1)-methyltransferase|nr:cobalt-precorrin-5B (C(1))-methyltransferase CbiD [Synergistaceae bacterium]